MDPTPRHPSEGLLPEDVATFARLIAEGRSAPQAVHSLFPSISPLDADAWGARLLSEWKTAHPYASDEFASYVLEKPMALKRLATLALYGRDEDIHLKAIALIAKIKKWVEEPVGNLNIQNVQTYEESLKYMRDHKAEIEQFLNTMKTEVKTGDW